MIRGLSELHLRVMLERLKERFAVEVTTRPPRIAYRETVSARAEGHHRHKKQTGGSGQFGRVIIDLEPTEPGSGYEFVNAVTGGRVPREYIPAVDQGIKEAMQFGVLAGYPVDNISATLTDGAYHDVDSSEMAFKIAGNMVVNDVS